jgi:hypothetical protein
MLYENYDLSLLKYNSKNIVICTYYYDIYLHDFIYSLFSGTLVEENTMNLSKRSVDKELFSRERSSKENIILNGKQKKILHNYIEDNLTENKYIGKIILYDLIKKVFHCERLVKIANQYNMDVADLLDNY